jgi:hypothetical protein
MVETIIDGKWHWYSIATDLESQGGLPGVVVYPTSVGPHSCGGETREGVGFFITWVKDELLMLSMFPESVGLVEAFAKILEYRPFCKYINPNEIITYEWDSIDPLRRITQLREEGFEVELL